MLVPGCGSDRETVVVYTALDEMYSQPVLEAFTAATGIEVLPVYDTEASKTTGLVSRIIAEADRPRADVFWNNEVAQTIVLQRRNLLEAYRSPSAEAIPDAFKDPDGFWTGFAARGRVITYNTDLVSEPPTSIEDLLDETWSGRAAIAKPLFGTTATHAAALFALWGEDRAKEFFRGLTTNSIAVLAGNATVRDLVASGEYAWGLTDTDDANGAVEDGRPAKWLFPDQDDGALGTLIIPNTVALVKGAPHPDAAKQLIDYLLSPDVEAALARTRSIQIPLNPNVEAPENVPKLADIRTMDVAFTAMAEAMEPSAEFLREEFLH
jgi:iron(III) transport system substrate-binding protein